MKSLRELYRMGKGPSSSHTMAPLRAMSQFVAENPQAHSFRVTLFGSLAATGKGHLTDKALFQATNGRPMDIKWLPNEELPLYSGGMRLEALSETSDVLASREEYSTGGGALLSDGQTNDTYPDTGLTEILSHCHKQGITLWEYVAKFEGDEIWDYLAGVWAIMQKAIQRGLETEGILPGSLQLKRKAPDFYKKSTTTPPNLIENAGLIAYAYAVAEENASGGLVVTAPTCGACGVLPAVLYSNQQSLEKDIHKALATAGLIGNLVKSNGSISGARVGCQGEIGTACAMAAAAITQFRGGDLNQIEYAAEMGLEHHFGLTCDPVDGLVQIPCIERNAHAALRARDCAQFALLSDGQHLISFDDAVAVLLETGQALPALYKETSTGGLARIYKKGIAKLNERSSD